MIKKIGTIIIACLTLSMNSQERCSTEEITEKMKELNPQYAIEREKVNHQTEKWIEKNKNHTPKTIITIPVVVHVVWKTNHKIYLTPKYSRKLMFLTMTTED